MNILQHNEITQKSIPVTDIKKQVLPLIEKMAISCRIPRGNKIGIAIAHCQVEKTDPLTFYVFANGDTVVNPQIISVKEKTLMWHKEGCLSFINHNDIKVKRYRIIKAKYILIQNGKIFNIEKNISDMNAYVMQHETDHFNLKYIYDFK